MYFRKIAFYCCILVLSGCQSQTRTPVEKALQQAIDNQPDSRVEAAPLAELPEDVAHALQADAPAPGAKLYGEPRYDIQADKVNAQDFFAGLVKDTPYSVAIHPQVEGTISLNLKQVTLTELFSITSEIYGYDIQKTGRIYRIYPAGMRTETFSVNYLLMQRNGMTRSTINSGGVSQNENGQNNNYSSQSSSTRSALGGTGSNSSQPNSFGNGSQSINGTNITTNTDTDFWGQLKTSLESLIGTEQGRQVVVSPQAGLITVRAMPDEIRTIKDYLHTSEQHIQRQVVLEARIIEVVLNDEYQQGINWQQVAEGNVANIDSTLLPFSFTGQIAGNAVSAAMGGITNLGFINKDFTGVLSLLATQGNVQVLSSPRVTATNNQKAVIKVGNDEYFVTDVSSQLTSTATTTSSTPNIELTPFFSGIALDVTPQIDKDGGVMLHVHPSVIDTQEQEKVLTLNQEKIILPLAQSNIRESDTVIRAKSGEIVVIGGLMQSVIDKTESKTPLLGDIPILGNLFKNKRNKETKKELVILLRPTVVGVDTWKNQLRQSQQHIVDWTNGE
ncbi:pilus (MSHA type) biogenesis protein MshL [Neptunicella sp. SCSIO 80796]|uniref:pilus (MSHA type) biogenesis protein MshL n=1 Tax=Neptunicella plasticusilytica TaxID=3117012 RepID=UPI003A4D267E